MECKVVSGSWQSFPTLILFIFAFHFSQCRLASNRSACPLALLHSVLTIVFIYSWFLVWNEPLLFLQSHCGALCCGHETVKLATIFFFWCASISDVITRGFNHFHGFTFVVADVVVVLLDYFYETTEIRNNVSTRRETFIGKKVK